MEVQNYTWDLEDIEGVKFTFQIVFKVCCWRSPLILSVFYPLGKT